MGVEFVGLFEDVGLDGVAFALDTHDDDVTCIGSHYAFGSRDALRLKGASSLDDNGQLADGDEMEGDFGGLHALGVPVAWRK